MLHVIVVAGIVVVVVVEVAGGRLVGRGGCDGQIRVVGCQAVDGVEWR